jgi:hypothetical protein
MDRSRPVPTVELSPEIKYRNTEKNQDKTGEGITGFINKQNDHNYHGGNNIEPGDNRISERFIRSRDIRLLYSQHKYCQYSQSKENQNGKYHIIKKVAICS